jgi:hypothetical protein
VIFPYDVGVMGSDGVTPQVARSDAEAHYTNLLAYFKHLVWLTGGALGLVVLVAGYLFHSNLQDSLRDVRQDAKAEATQVAREEAERGVKAVLSGTDMKELVQRVAQEGVAEAVTADMVEEKVGPLADRMVEHKLQPVEQRMLLLGRISDEGTRMRVGLRSGLDELRLIANGTGDPKALQFAKDRLTLITNDYDTVEERNVQRSPTHKAIDALGTYRFGERPSSLHDVVQIIDNDADLNYVALAFLAFRDLSGEQYVKMFDFTAVKSWCASHQPKCQ